MSTVSQVPEKEGKGLRELLQRAQLSGFFFNSYIEMELVKIKCHMTHSFNMHNSRVFMHSQILVNSIVNFGIFSSLPN